MSGRNEKASSRGVGAKSAGGQGRGGALRPEQHQPRRSESKTSRRNPPHPGSLKDPKENPSSKPQTTKENSSKRPQTGTVSAGRRDHPRAGHPSSKNKPGRAVQESVEEKECYWYPRTMKNVEVKDMPQKNVEKFGWECPKCTFKNNPTRPGCEQCSTARPSEVHRTTQDAVPMWVCSQCQHGNPLNRTTCEECHSRKKVASAGDKEQQHRIPDAVDGALGGWACPQCSYVNRPRRPGCEMCGGEPPADYDLSEAPADPEEEARLRKQKENEKRFLEAMDKKQQKELEELCQKDNQLLVEPDEPFECSVCMYPVEVEDGVRLRGCLHDMCKQCIIDSVTNEETGVVHCGICGFEVEDRDIQNVVDPELWERRLKMTLRIGESKVKNTFHCLTPDCEGWVEVVDKFNYFICEVCKTENCLVCKAQHPNLTCRQHQDEQSRSYKTEEEAKATLQYIEDMIKDGVMMRCVGCQLVLQKKAGCDWMQCPQCELELCWATRGPRWGPKGYGDISGGCQCGINGSKCHPSCGFCH